MLSPDIRVGIAKVVRQEVSRRRVVDTRAIHARCRFLGKRPLPSVGGRISLRRISEGSVRQ
jgi:hypothetical protein